MITICIREYISEQNRTNAIVSINDDEEYPATIKDPFSQKEEHELEWYFEEHLSFPFLEEIRARNAAKSIITYGETLFQQVFQNPDAYAAYKHCLGVGLQNIQFKIIGDPSFHHYHWESLKDPHLPRPFALDSTMIRQNKTPQTLYAAIRESPTINVLLVTARPFGRNDVGYRTISRPLVDLISQTKIPVHVDIVRPGTYEALVSHLQQKAAEYGPGYYHILHFDTHGALLTYDQLNQGLQINRYIYQQRYGRTDIPPYKNAKAFLFLDGYQDLQADPVELKELANLLLVYQIPIAILNVCQSAKQLEGVNEASLGNHLVEAGMQLVLAMSYSVTVTAAKLMMHKLYEQLFQHQNFSYAIRYARQELYSCKGRDAYYQQNIDLEDWLLPVVYQNRSLQLNTSSFTPDEAKDFYERQANSYKAPAPYYGFIGRDIDILQIEKYLLTKCNILLVNGMAGSGKTTLMQHLGEWWQKTHLVKHVFYFAYNEKRWTRRQILFNIASQLLSPTQYRSLFQPLTLDAQQAMLTQHLRSERHLLIFDNLETITGVQLATKQALSLKEQSALHCFLIDLTSKEKGSFILLGSRSNEAWLSKGTFEENIYNLQGLDIEAASTLTEYILVKHNVTVYRETPELQYLLKILNGFPLAIEIILANLAQKTPREIIDALKLGDVKIDASNNQEYTKSILKCIDYSHRNLSQELQTVLLCLAPFTSVISQSLIPQYINFLQKQPALKHLPFAQFTKVLDQAEHWGLLHKSGGNLELQPVLPYFLQNRFSELGQIGIKQGIEVAFYSFYNSYSCSLIKQLLSKDFALRQQGLEEAELEFSNFITALNLSFINDASTLTIYTVISTYLRTVNNREFILMLGSITLNLMELLSNKIVQNKRFEEFFAIIEDISIMYSDIEEYGMAENVLFKCLTLLGEENIQEVKLKRATIYHELGMVAQEKYDWEQAEVYYQQALQISLEIKDYDGEAHTLHQEGLFYQERRSWDKAEEYFKKALVVWEKLGNIDWMINAYVSLGTTLGEKKDWDKAREYYEVALELLDKNNMHYGKSSVYHQIGSMAQKQGIFADAKINYERALKIEEEYGNIHGQGDTLTHLGTLMQSCGEYNEAQHYYECALHIWVEVDLIELLEHIII